MTVPVQQALDRLLAGNERYLAERCRTVDRRAQRRETQDGQAPFAVVLGCADSRVPPEVVFDQGLGDLFVVRVAGAVPTPAVLGSVEYAVEHLGTRLVVVLGHSDCGAVLAALAELERPDPELSPHLAAIVERISPAIVDLTSEPAATRTARAVRANVRAGVAALRDESELLATRRRDGLRVVGAEYSLASGRVTLLDDPAV